MFLSTQNNGNSWITNRQRLLLTMSKIFPPNCLHLFPSAKILVMCVGPFHLFFYYSLSLSHSYWCAVYGNKIFTILLLVKRSIRKKLQQALFTYLYFSFSASNSSSFPINELNGFFVVVKFQGHFYLFVFFNNNENGSH